ncbi:MAG: PepSY domain-containing protein [Actinomycetota bacterium]|nr:PepSY domain-containing protein [Actinomycetota bacterium]
MKNLSKTKAFVVVILSIGIIGALTVAARGLVVQPNISPDQAAVAVKGFAETANVKAIALDELPMKRLVYSVTAEDGRTFWVDAKTGQVAGVVGYVDADPVDLAQLPLTKDAAVNKAEAFVKGKYARFDELTLTNIANMVDGSYLITWTKIAPNGAKLLRSVTIGVDPRTGKLGLYSARDEEEFVATSPKILKDEALRIVRSKLTSRATINECDLAVLKDKNGQQKLVWYAMYDDVKASAVLELKSSGTIFIDANNGDDITRDFSAAQDPTPGKQ